MGTTIRWDVIELATAVSRDNVVTRLGTPQNADYAAKGLRC